MKSFGGHPSSQLVSNALERYLNNTYGSWPVFQVRADGRFHKMRWSSIHIYRVQRAARFDHYVIKIPRLPDQLSPELSWQSESLLKRGRREYTSIARIYNHFSAQDNPALQALRPGAYLPEINAVVMNFVPSSTLYESAVTIRHLLSSKGRKRALEYLHVAGQWLGWLHNLPTDNTAPVPADTLSAGLATLLASAEQLSTHTAGPQQLTGWPSTLNILHTAKHNTPVWIHGDFHMGNVLALPSNAILSIDAVLNTLDDPCVDIAKMIVDLRTRRWRLITQGKLPTDPFIEQLIASFLLGYQTHGKPLNPLILALYEGVYLLEKWLQCHTTMNEQVTPSISNLVKPLLNSNIDRVMTQMVKNWMGRVHQLGS
ncbi:MAG: phosphotransferase [Anaerolineae bacterium]|nr:phosphotransferase [Anaerolineae bacterium]